MTSQPWWAIPLFTLAGALLTQTINIIADQLKRRSERLTRWDKDKTALYQAYQRDCTRVLRVPVWPTDPTAPPPPAGPLLVTLFDRNEELPGLSHRTVTAAANTAAAAAHELVTTIEDIRRTTRRGPAGAVDDAAGVRLAEARRSLAAAIDAFAVAWRRDLGITAPYTAGLSSEERFMITGGEG